MYNNNACHVHVPQHHVQVKISRYIYTVYRYELHPLPYMLVRQWRTGYILILYLRSFGVRDRLAIALASSRLGKYSMHVSHILY